MHALNNAAPVPAPVPNTDSRSRDALVISLALFGLCTLACWLCVRRTLSYEGELVYRVADALVSRGSLQIQDPVFGLGQPYPPYGIGVSVFLIPLVALGHVLSHDGRYLISLYQPAVTGLTVVVLQRLLVELGVGARRSLLLSLLYAFGTIAWYYSGIVFSEPLLGLCTVAALLWLLCFERSGRRRFLAFAGLALGLTVVVRWDSLVLILIPMSLYFGYWARKRSKWGRQLVSDVLAFVGPILVASAGAVAYDWVRFGHPFAGVPGAAAVTPGQVWNGVTMLLVSPGAGLFVYMPIMLMALVGAPGFYARWRPEAMMVGALLVARLIAGAILMGIDNGASWGPRPLMAVMPLLIVPIAFIPRYRVVRIVAALLALASVGIEAVGQAVPYGLYYAQAAHALLPQIKAQCQGCPPFRLSLALDAAIRGDWHNAPLLGQIQLLSQGVVDPLWELVAVFVPVVVFAMGVALMQVYRLAAKMDGARV